MTTARNEMMTEGVEAVYHCLSRCVRGAHLCATNPDSGQGYDHRKEWIRGHIRELAAGYAVEVAAYAILSNHLHLVLRTRPDWVESWTDREAAGRWLSLFAQSRAVEDKGSPPSDSEIKAVTGNKERLAELRLRLSSVSWFMRSLNEYVSRRANREEACKGRFWEGRFIGQILLDESAVLAGMAFVDLNPVRAGLAEGLDESDYTSVKERSEELAKVSVDPSWLCPIGNEGGQERRGILPLTRDEYLSLLDWTGSQVRLDKPGDVPGHLAPVLERLEINQSQWVGTVADFGKLFHRVVGRPASILSAARQADKAWLAGLAAGKKAFSTT